MKRILLICMHIVAVPHKWMFDMTANDGKKTGKGIKPLKTKQKQLYIYIYTVQSNPDIKDI